MFLFLAVTAEVRPRHRFQARFRDRLLAGLTRAEGAPVDPSQGIFNRARKATVGLVQVDLKLRFGLHCRLVNQVSPWPSCSHHRSQSLADNSSSLASNNCLYRCNSLTSTIGAPTHQAEAALVRTGIFLPASVFSSLTSSTPSLSVALTLSGSMGRADPRQRRSDWPAVRNTRSFLAWVTRMI